MNEARPNPDALLAALQRDESKQRRGRLKVFLGMCPGVGKTYAMLEAARREHAAGSDVVLGYVETHGRKETDALAEGSRKFRDARSITVASCSPRWIWMRCWRANRNLPSSMNWRTRMRRVRDIQSVTRTWKSFSTPGLMSLRP